MSSPAMTTAMTGLTGMKSNTITNIISSMMAAATGALKSSDTFSICLSGRPSTTQFSFSWFICIILSHWPCTSSMSPLRRRWSLSSSLI